MAFLHSFNSNNNTRAAAKVWLQPENNAEIIFSLLPKIYFGRCPVRASQHHVVEIAQCDDANGYCAEKFELTQIKSQR